MDEALVSSLAPHVVGAVGVVDDAWPVALAAIAMAIGAPALSALLLALVLLLRVKRPGEDAVFRVVVTGLDLSLVASIVLTVALLVDGGIAGEHEAGRWVAIGNYSVPVVFLIDGVAVAFSALASSLTALVARFSRTYLHRERGFARFFLLLALFGSGAQLVALSGAFDLFFAGWELLGVSSMLFIGFFFERAEPVRSAMRAFATYRVCDVGFFVAVIATHEVFGTTRLSVLHAADSVPVWQRSTIAALFLLAALGKSAQLPFSSWLPRAMEGPTPTSALFYGGVSIHAGLYLVLRVWPVLDAAPVVEVVGVVLGLLTAGYGALLARVQSDAKGALAHATLAQTGLILAEIAAGLTTLALVHLVGHALLRVWQYLRAPNTLHDAHHRGHAPPSSPWWERLLPDRLRVRLYAAGVHRFRLDDRLDTVVAPVLSFAAALDDLDRRVRALTSLERDDTNDADGTDGSPR